jgi:hypothetical protein
MGNVLRLLRGGFLRRYRPQVLGVAAGLGGIADALALWAVGDRSLVALVRAIGENWALIAAGFGLATLAAKIERREEQGVQEIAEEALRRN